MALFEFGGKGGKTDTDIGSIYWDKINRLAQMDQAYNRLDRYGPFGGWEYTAPELEYDSKGNPTGKVLKEGSQKFVATDPGMQAAQERMSRRLAGEGFDAYTPPAQVSSITDALMSSRMERMGILGEGSRPNLAQENYGTRFGDRAGGAWDMSTRSPYTTPPPQEGQPPPQGGQPPPQGGQPPPGGNRPGVRPQQPGMGFYYKER